MAIRKIIYAAAFLPMFILCSCFSNSSPPDPDPLDPGRFIYSLATQQNDLSIAPADMIFRLNALLNEANAAGITHTVAALSQMKVTINKSEVYAFSYLFPDGILRTVSGDDYTFDLASINRSGKVVISTGGKLLEEEGSSWTVSLKGSMSDNYIHYFHTNVKTYDIEVVDNGGFGISKAEDKPEWEIYFSGVGLTSRDYKQTSNWSGAFTVSRSEGTGPMNIETLGKSAFDMAGSAHGTTFQGVDMSYEIIENAPLRIIPACYRSNYLHMFNMIETGAEKAAFSPEEDINTEHYPARDVSMEWFKGNGCSSTIKISYNGLSSAN